MGALLAVSLALASNAPATDPLVPAASGLMQCYKPDVATKHCQSLASYQALGNGRYINSALVLISKEHGIALETVSNVNIRDGQVCGFVRPEDIRAGKLHVSGQTLAPDSAAPILAQIVQFMSPQLDKEICTAYVAAPTGLIAKATMAGMPLPEQPVLWVRPEDGFSVG